MEYITEIILGVIAAGGLYYLYERHQLNKTKSQILDLSDEVVRLGEKRNKENKKVEKLREEKKSVFEKIDNFINKYKHLANKSDSDSSDS